MAQYFIGIDVSTTASKAVVIDTEGNVVATQGYPHKLSTPKPLWSEQDPEDWWQATSSSLRDVLKEVDPADVAAIGLTGQMHGLTPMDENGGIVRPALLWNDQRSGQQCAEITGKIGEQKLYQKIGSILLPGFTAPKLLWVKQNEPEMFEKVKHILLPKDYVRFRLSGEYVADVADGSGFGLMDIASRDWDDEMIEAFGFDRAILPKLVESQEVCAYVSEEAAAATGLKVGTPIVGGAGDQPAGGVGSGIVNPGMVSMSIGTSGVAYAANPVYSPEPDGRLHTFCGPVPGTWFHMGVMLSAAGGLRWFHDEIAGGRSYDEINAMVENVPIGSLGLLFAPYLTGERNPHPDPLARGAFVGFTLRHGIAEMARSVMEGVAFGMRDQLELLRAQGIEPADSVVGGGAAKSPVWRQMITDIMGIPLYTVNTTEGAAFGAAILAAVGAGAYPDVPTATEAMVRKVDQTEPNPQAVQRYNELYPAYTELYGALKWTYASLAAFEDV
ncbi:MAG: xylulokinase [Chloroflexota bacterium]